jgi:hypothetical protein
MAFNTFHYFGTDAIKSKLSDEFHEYSSLHNIYINNEVCGEVYQRGCQFSYCEKKIENYCILITDSLDMQIDISVCDLIFKPAHPLISCH